MDLQPPLQLSLEMSLFSGFSLNIFNHPKYKIVFQRDLLRSASCCCWDISEETGKFPFTHPQKKHSKRRTLPPALPQFIYLFTSSTQGAEESPESADTLQLDDKQQNDEDHTLQREGHEVAAHTRLWHGEVVFLVGDVYNQKNTVMSTRLMAEMCSVYSVWLTSYVKICLTS